MVSDSIPSTAFVYHFGIFKFAFYTKIKYEA